MTQPIASCIAAGLLLAVSHGPAEARITRLQITTVQSPTFEGRTFGTGGVVGTYEKLIGRAYGEVDPNDPRNALIIDLVLAPRNASGKVEYAMDVYILKPVDMHLGNRKLFVEVNNRGNKLFGAFNGAPITNDPTTAADAGSAFLMNQGYALAWGGWDPTAAPGGSRLTIQVPVAHNADGSLITGPSYEYLVFDNATTVQAGITYPADSLDTTLARLTVRQHLTDTPTLLAPTDWQFVNAKTIQLLPAGTCSGKALSTSFRTRPEIRSSRVLDSRQRATSSPFCGTRQRTTSAIRTRWPARRGRRSLSRFRSRRVT